MALFLSCPKKATPRPETAFSQEFAGANHMCSTMFCWLTFAEYLLRYAQSLPPRRIFAAIVFFMTCPGIGGRQPELPAIRNP